MGKIGTPAARAASTRAAPQPEELLARCARLEAQLAEAETRLTDFLEVASDWIWEMDDDLRFTFFSGRLREVSGADPQYFIGKTRSEVMRDTSSPEARRHLAELASRRPFRNYVYISETPGGMRTFKISGKPIFDGAGRFRGYRGTGTDITAEVEANRRAEAIHGQFVEAIESIPASLMLFDAEDRLVICNSITASFFPKATHLLRPGTSFEELLRAHGESGIVPEATADFEGWVRRRMAAHRDPGEAIVRRWGDGRYVQIIERRTSDGGTIGVRMDVTELTRREAELSAARGQLRGAIETMPASFVLYDPEGKVVLCNSKSREFFPEIAELLEPGSDIETLTRRRFERTQPGATAEAIETMVRRRLAQFRDPGEAVREQLPDGRWTQAFERRMADGATVCIRVDITELKNQEEAIAAHSRELERSNQELEQFAYVASHDLQEPLRMVGSYCQLLQRRYRGKLDADADEFIGYAVEGATRMQRMINDLLAYSRVGRRENPFAPIDTDALVATALDNLRAAIEESGARIRIGKLPAVTGDRTQLAQLFQNLIGNAVKFRGEAPVEVSIDAAPEGDGYRFTVADNGIGIEKDYLDKIFLIFQRLHDRSKYPGTGIGLAICKKVVERHGERIWVESEPGKGSRFIFTLPSDFTPPRDAQREGDAT
jgi:PAS domain S-box-containing protein